MFGHNTQKSQEFKIISQKVQCHCRFETWYHCVRKSNIVFIIEVTLFRQQSLDLFRSGFRTAAPSFGGMSEVFSWPRPRHTATAWSTTRWSSLSSRKTRQVIYIYLNSYFLYFFSEVSTVCNGAYPTYTSTWRPPASPGLGQGRAELSRHAHSDSGHSLDTANLFSAAAAAGVNPACYSQELRSKMSDYSGWRYWVIPPS